MHYRGGRQAGAGNILTVSVTQRFSFITPLVTQFFGTLNGIGGCVDRRSSVSAVGGGGGPGHACAGPVDAHVHGLRHRARRHRRSDGLPADTGPCAISGYNWDFGDGDTDVGSSIPVTHTYASLAPTRSPSR